MISYEPFWETLKEKNVSTYVLIRDKHVSSSTLQRMRYNESISLQTVEDLCNALQCGVCDIVEIIPDKDTSKN